MPNYNNSIKRTVQNLLFEGINSKRVIGLAGPTPEEYMDILQNHAKEVYVCDYEPSRPYVERTSLIGLYQLKNPSWVDADFCSSIIDNWNDILYIWKELQMSKFQTIYFTFNVSLRTGRSHGYTYDWIKNNIMNFNIVNTQTIKGDGKEYIKKHTTDNPNIMLIEYFSTSYMLSVRLKYEWEIDISIECKRIIISSPYSTNRNRLIKTVSKWFEQGYVPHRDGSKKDNHHLLLKYVNLPTKKQYEIGMRKKATSIDGRNQKVIHDLKNYLNEHKEFPRMCTNEHLTKRVGRLRKNSKYSKIIKELEIEYGYRPNRSKETTFLEFEEYVLKHNKIPKCGSNLYRRMRFCVYKYKDDPKYSKYIELWNEHTRTNKTRRNIQLELEEYILKYDKLPSRKSSLGIKVFNAVYRHKDDPKYSRIIELWKKYKSRSTTQLKFKEYVLKHKKLPGSDTSLYKNITTIVHVYKDDPRYAEIVELWNKYKRRKINN